ncbi:hypothetical protein B0I35DRAFT_111446 [Stachybotrys elegans]|uniref:Uncharacterized protein n=1 Tax=Stachybotrys elegans TaxID=80388 RepID=A0A8K0SER4_9HYPO|nr:hypothetical protein B0I35DRAFT_111446 [Stachybotrys elegans]
MPDYEQIANQAEADLNTYQSKTGVARPEGLDEAGINSFVEKKFEGEGAKVTYGDELSTNRGYNKRIPPSEGGLEDKHRRQTRGQDFEGEGGPEDKIRKAREEAGGYDDDDVVPAHVDKPAPAEASRDIAEAGLRASKDNVGSKPPGPGGSKYKGEDYYTPESVPDSISAEGWVAPESVTQASREAEGYETR